MTVWKRIELLPPNDFSDFCREEYPQTVAFIFSQLNPRFVGKLMGILPENFACEVLMRMVRLEVVPDETLRELETILEKTLTLPPEQKNGLDAVKDVFLKMDHDTYSRLQPAINERNKDVGDYVNLKKGNSYE